MLISEPYREQNRLLHEAKVNFGEGGHQWAGHVDALARTMKAISILDYGAGQRTLEKVMARKVTSYDPAIDGISEAPIPHHLVVSTDVLEHIEPDCVDDVLDDMRRLTLKAAFITVACVPALKTLPDGRNAHLIVEPVDWWLPRLMSRWRLAEAANYDHGFSFIGVAP